MAKRTVLVATAALMLAVASSAAEAHNFGRGGFAAGGGSGHGFGSFQGANHDPRAAPELGEGLDLDRPGAGRRDGLGSDDGCAAFGSTGFGFDPCG